MSPPKTQRPLPSPIVQPPLTYPPLGYDGELPCCLHMERAVLGCLIIDNTVWEQAKELRKSDFLLDSHQRIFQVIARFMGEGNPIDYLIVYEELKKTKEIDTIGGPAYIAYLSEGIPRNFNIESYVLVLRDYGRLRRIIGCCHNAIVRAYDCSSDPLEIVTSLQKQLGL